MKNRNRAVAEGPRLYLIGMSAFFGVVLFAMLFYWLLSVRPHQVERAKSIGQYYYYTMDNLPFISNQVKAVYNKNPSVLPRTEDVMEDKRRAAALAANDNLLDDLEQELAQIASSKNGVGVEKKQIQFSGGGYDSDAILQEESKGKKRPKIAILVTNLGISRRANNMALSLPEQCALGFVPYMKAAKEALMEAAHHGHEIYLYMPMQTKGGSAENGKYTLMENAEPEENATRLNLILGSYSNYQGLYGSYKENFTDSAASEFVFDTLEDKGLLFVSGRNLKGKENLSGYNNIISAHVLIDAELNKVAIKKQLQKLIEVAQKKGEAVGYAHGFVLTIDLINRWLPSLKKYGIDLVPLSAISRVGGR